MTLEYIHMWGVGILALISLVSMAYLYVGLRWLNKTLVHVLHIQADAAITRIKQWESIISLHESQMENLVMHQRLLDHFISMAENIIQQGEACKLAHEVVVHGNAIHSVPHSSELYGDERLDLLRETWGYRSMEEAVSEMIPLSDEQLRLILASEELPDASEKSDHGNECTCPACWSGEAKSRDKED